MQIFSFLISLTILISIREESFFLLSSGKFHFEDKNSALNNVFSY